MKPKFTCLQSGTQDEPPAPLAFRMCEGCGDKLKPAAIICSKCKRRANE